MVSRLLHYRSFPAGSRRVRKAPSAVNGLGELSLLAGDWLVAEVDADLADSLLAFALGPLPGSQS